MVNSTTSQVPFQIAEANLQVLSFLNAGEKLCVDEKQIIDIDKRPLQGLVRWIAGDGWDKSLLAIRATFEKIIDDLLNDQNLRLTEKQRIRAVLISAHERVKTILLRTYQLEKKEDAVKEINQLLEDYTDRIVGLPFYAVASAPIDVQPNRKRTPSSPVIKGSTPPMPIPGRGEEFSSAGTRTSVGSAGDMEAFARMLRKPAVEEPSADQDD